MMRTLRDNGGGLARAGPRERCYVTLTLRCFPGGRGTCCGLSCRPALEAAVVVFDFLTPRVVDYYGLRRPRGGDGGEVDEGHS